MSHCGFRGFTPYPRIGFIFQNFKASGRLYEVMSVLGLAPWILVSGVSVSMFCTEKETRSSTERNYVQMGLDCSIGTSSSLAYKCEGANMYRRPKQTHWMSPLLNARTHTASSFPWNGTAKRNGQLPCRGFSYGYMSGGHLLWVAILWFKSFFKAPTSTKHRVHFSTKQALHRGFLCWWDNAWTNTC